MRGARELLGGASAECEAPNNRLYAFEGRWARASTTSAKAPSTPTRIAIPGDDGDGDGDPLTTTPCFGEDENASPEEKKCVLAGIRTSPLCADNLLLRGSTLRNTAWVLGVVAYTGADSKLVRNMAKAPHKVSRLERDMNVLVAFVAVTQFATSLWLAFAHRDWLDAEMAPKKIMDDGVRGVPGDDDLGAGGGATHHSSSSPDALSSSSSSSDEGSSTNHLISNPRHWYLRSTNAWPDADDRGPGGVATAFVRNVVLLNALIPISLYVTLELVKVAQCAFVAWDEEMRDAETGRRCGVRTTSLNEELGQVRCVLSDKTGTLTRNVMAFVACSVNGVVHRSDEGGKGVNGEREKREDERLIKGGEASDASEASDEEGGVSRLRVVISDDAAAAAKGHQEPHRESHQDYSSTPSGSSEALAMASSFSAASETHSVARSSSLRRAVAARDPAVAAFLEHLAACHTVVPSPEAPEDCSAEAFEEKSASSASPPTQQHLCGVRYRAASPDEEALVAGAALLGRRLASNAGGRVVVETHPADGSTNHLRTGASAERGVANPPDPLFEKTGDEESTFERTDAVRTDAYEVLAVNEFTSARKRMSVLVRDASGRTRLLLKGADAAVFARCVDETSPLHDAAVARSTRAHLDQFAREGLRTLVLARRDVTDEEARAWLATHADAQRAIKNRDARLAEAAEAIERECVLVGATAVEDKLQAGVPETIAMLREAGILVWMLTGDKLETAVSIAGACRLVDRDGDLVVLDDQTLEPFGGSLVPAAENGGGGLLSKEGGAFKSSSSSSSSSSSDACASFLRAKAEEVRREVALGSSIGLVVEGGALAKCLATSARERAFLDACAACSGVVCCRASPMQKAKVADAMKRRGASAARFHDRISTAGRGEETTTAPVYYGASGQSRPANLRESSFAGFFFRRIILAAGSFFASRGGGSFVTLGVGDGANDVGMIKAAHVGVGISGREGRAAVLASDFSVGEFRHLARLLLAHGRWSAKRNREAVLYAFYKNFAYAMANVWLGWFNGFSAQPLYTTAAIATFNVLWTSLPTVAHACLDQDVRAEDVFERPRLYLETSEVGAYSFLRDGVAWLLCAVFHGVWCFAVCFGALGAPRASSADGKHPWDAWATGVAAFTAVVVTCDVKVASRTNHWTWINALAVGGSVAMWFPFARFAVGDAWKNFGVFASVSDVHSALFLEPRFWLALVVAVGGCAAMDLACESLRRAVAPENHEIVREMETMSRKPAFARRASEKETNAREKKTHRNTLFCRSAASRESSSASSSSSSSSSSSAAWVRRAFGRWASSLDVLPTTTRAARGPSRSVRGRRATRAVAVPGGARRKSRNPSVVEVVKEHRNFSDDWCA